MKPSSSSIVVCFLVLNAIIAAAMPAVVTNVHFDATPSGGGTDDYLVVDVSGGPDAASYPVTYQTAPPPLDDTHKTSKIVLRKIPAGTFVMGPCGKLDRFDDLGGYNIQTQRVILTRPFYMGMYEITQAQYSNVMGCNPSWFQRGPRAPMRPVEQVSWNIVRGGTWPGGMPDGATFMGKLQSKTGLAFDLPTEAQWEYACRAGTTTTLNNNTDMEKNKQDPNMDILGRYRHNGGSSYESDPVNGGTAAVGLYLPNAWGLYDMHGNVWEWCLDWFDTYTGDAIDPSGPEEGLCRMFRGGSWANSAICCRSANRYFGTPGSVVDHIGFRVAMSSSHVKTTPGGKANAANAGLAGKMAGVTRRNLYNGSGVIARVVGVRTADVCWTSYQFTGNRSTNNIWKTAAVPQLVELDLKVDWPTAGDALLTKRLRRGVARLIYNFSGGPIVPVAADNDPRPAILVYAGRINNVCADDVRADDYYYYYNDYYYKDFNYDMNVKLCFASSNVIAVSCGGYGYIGGVHGNDSFVCSVFDARTGKVIHAQDAFRHGAKKELGKILAQRLQNSIMKYSSSFRRTYDAEYMEPPEMFLVDETGIDFRISDDGFLIIHLPFAAIRHLMATGTALRAEADAHLDAETSNRYIFTLASTNSTIHGADVTNVLCRATHSGGGTDDYLVVDVSGGPDAPNYPVTYQTSAPPQDDTHKTSKIVLRKIPAGTFMMGSPDGELGQCNDEDETQHTVTLTQQFYMGIYEITQAQYSNVMGTNPSYFTQGVYAPKRPVEQVSWDDVRDGIGIWSGGILSVVTPDGATFMGKLRSKTRLIFDLPTQYQWEYACRAGTTKALNNNTDLQDKKQDPNMDILGRYWYNGGSSYESDPVNGGTAAVGLYLPNAWGLYDMHGNVREWCLDMPRRGGSWLGDANLCRAAHHGWGNRDTRCDYMGFRVAVLAGHGISGRVIGEVRQGVTVMLSGTTRATTATDGNGNYSFAGLADGNYIVTPSYAVTPDTFGHTIDPSSRSVTISNANQTGMNFTAKKFTATVASESDMALIPAGSFAMGNAYNEGYCGERSTNCVFISAFYMDKTEVTKAKWDEVYTWAVAHGYTFDGDNADARGNLFRMVRARRAVAHGSTFDNAGDNAGLGKATNHPVQTVSWYDCVKWCNARSELEGRTPCYYADSGTVTVYRTGRMSPAVDWSARGYRLPTEAEWEKAARGGLDGRRFPWPDLKITHTNANYRSFTTHAYDTSTTRDHHPTFNDGTMPYTSPVGYFAPNGYGLYDMAGNVCEWCWDWYDGNYYARSPARDPRGPANGWSRVQRGGSWDSGASNCRVAYRYDYIDPPGIPPDGAYDYIGFRCVRGQ